MALMPRVDWRVDTVQDGQEPITYADLIGHLKLSTTDESDYLTSLCTVVRQAAERVTRRCLTYQATRVLVLQELPDTCIEFPQPPLTTVTGFQYKGADGALATWDPSNYQVSKPAGPNCRRGRLAPLPTKTWPVLGVGYLDSVQIAFTAGHSITGNPNGANPIPLEIAQGMYLLAGELYKTRSLSIQAINTTPAMVRATSIWLGYRPQA